MPNPPLKSTFYCSCSCSNPAAHRGDLTALYFNQSFLLHTISDARDETAAVGHRTRADPEVQELTNKRWWRNAFHLSFRWHLLRHSSPKHPARIKPPSSTAGTELATPHCTWLFLFPMSRFPVPQSPTHLHGKPLPQPGFSPRKQSLRKALRQAFKGPFLPPAFLIFS